MSVTVSLSLSVLFRSVSDHPPVSLYRLCILVNLEPYFDLYTCVSLSDLYSRILNHQIILFDHKFLFKIRNLSPIQGIIVIDVSCVGERGRGNHCPRGKSI